MHGESKRQMSNFARHAGHFAQMEQGGDGLKQILALPSDDLLRAIGTGVRLADKMGMLSPDMISQHRAKLEKLGNQRVFLKTKRKMLGAQRGAGFFKKLGGIFKKVGKAVLPVAAGAVGSIAGPITGAGAAAATRAILGGGIDDDDYGDY